MRRLASEFPNDNEALHGGVTWTVLAMGAPAAPVLRSDRASGIVVRDGAQHGRDGKVLEGLALAELVAAFDAPCDAAELLEEIDAFGGEGPVIVDELESFEGGGDLTVAADMVVGGDALAVEPRAGDALVGDALAGDALVGDALADTAPDHASEDDDTESEDSFLVLVDRLVELAVSEEPSAGRLVEHLLAATSAVPDLDEPVRASLVEGGIVDAAGVPSPTFVATVAAWRGILRGTSEDLLGACGGCMLDEWAADLVARVLGTPSRTDVLRKELRARGVAAFGLAWAA